mgnify:CR=1 FL=1
MLAAHLTMLGNGNWVAGIQNLESTLDSSSAKHVLLKRSQEMPARSSDVATMGLCEFAAFATPGWGLREHGLSLIHI